MKTLLDQFGTPLVKSTTAPARQIAQLKRELMRARYDAAQTGSYNENHWAMADQLDPHSAASYTVRKTLRSRSRYEVIENNPYLKGTVLTVCNDFTGCGPKLQITDQRVPKERRRELERQFQRWAKEIRLRQKLWRMRMSKIVDGESFLFSYTPQRLRHEVALNFFVAEADQVSAPDDVPGKKQTPYAEVDGVRFDRFQEPLAYHLLNEHPGGSLLRNFLVRRSTGQWIDSQFVVHWFRQDRGWLRGVPELTPSLPLCAILRRYTLAMLRKQEVSADFTAIIETEGPPGQNQWTDGNGNIITDDPFDTFPIEAGMITTLPWGYKMRQFSTNDDTTMYDVFVNALLREITRPILTPFNMAAGTSKDSNMASAVVDSHIYKGGQQVERTDCEESVLDKVFDLYWTVGRLSGALQDFTAVGEIPEHKWRWDRVGLDHTDPQKVMGALETAHTNKFLTDRDIQEGYFNRDVDDWREDVLEDDEFREQFEPEIPEPVDPNGQPQDDADPEE